MASSTRRALLLAAALFTPLLLPASPLSAQKKASLEDIERMQFPAIRLGQTIAGQLTTADVLRADDTYADGFSYVGRSGERLVITMRSADFDAWAVIDDPNGPLYEWNDDGAGGTDSRLEITLPHDGRYIILANSVSQSTGAYTLLVERAR
jgi:hypothetical protein